MNIFRFINKLRLSTRINFLITSLIAIILSSFGFYIYYTEEAKLFNAYDYRIKNYLHTLNFYIDEKINYTYELSTRITSYYADELNAYQLHENESIPINADETSHKLRPILIHDDMLTAEVKKFFIGTGIQQNSNLMLVIIYKNGTMHMPFTEESKHIANTKLFDNIKRISGTIVHRINYSSGEKKNENTRKIMYVKYVPSYNAYIGISMDRQYLYGSLSELRNIIIICSLLAILLVSLLIGLIMQPVVKPIRQLVETLDIMSKGKIAQEITYPKEDEIAAIVSSLNMLIKGLERTTIFSKEIGSGNLNTQYSPLSNEDELGNSLLEMRESLKKAEEARQKQDKEEEERNWATAGQAKFADILRNHNSNVNELSYSIISEMVKYVGANQGGIFIINNDDRDNIYLEMMACFAYDRRKYITKHITIGEGLVGTCFLEGETIIITDVPPGYMDISSGLGDTDPKYIALIPLKINEEVHGVIEIASLSELPQYKIQFIEKIGEIIASTIASTKINMKTKMLLEQYQQQSEEMKAQEEELRQNMEELQATQEEAARKEIQLEGTINAINNAIGSFEMDMEGTITGVNKLYLSITGTSQNDLIGKNIRNFMDKNKVESEVFQKIWNNLMEGIPHSGGHQYFFDGKEKWLYETFSPVKDENNMYSKIICLSYDISRVRKIEKDLENYKHLYETLSEEIKTLKNEKKG